LLPSQTGAIWLTVAGLVAVAAFVARVWHGRDRNARPGP